MMISMYTNEISARADGGHKSIDNGTEQSSAMLALKIAYH